MAAEQNATMSLVDGEHVPVGQRIPIATQKGVAMLRAHADLGNVIAQFNTGLRYHHGDGVPKSRKMAETYLLMAAIDGHAESQFLLAINRLRPDYGLTVTTDTFPSNDDFLFAYKWFTIAKANGHETGNSLTVLEGNMTEEQIAEAKTQAEELLN